jgi:hypothetical protein
VNCIHEAEKSAQELLKLVTEHFPSFRDVHHFRGQDVSIYKRAQILIADVWCVLQRHSVSSIVSIGHALKVKNGANFEILTM